MLGDGLDTRSHDVPTRHLYGAAFLDPGAPAEATLTGDPGLLDGPAHGDHSHPSKFPVYSTAGRPAATDLEGHCYYDSTLNKPAWSDGTDWRDAAGSVV